MYKQNVTYKQNSDKGLSKRYRSNIVRSLIAVVVLFTCTAKAELLLNGSTLYTDLGRDQFVAALYTETAQNSAQIIESMKSNKRMEVRILNNYSKRRWINLWMQSISINNGRETFSDSAEDLIALMQAPKSAPQKGDILEYIFSPERGTSLRFNGTELIGDLSGEVFGLLLRTWIGAIPPSTTFKEELLGNKRNSHAQNLLAQITPDQERVSLAASWIIPLRPVAIAPQKVVVPEVQVGKLPTSSLKETSTVVSTVESTPTVTEDIAVTSKDTDDFDQHSASQNPDTDTTASVTPETGSAVGTEEPKEPEDDIIDFNVAEALAQRDYTPLVVQQIYQHISYPSRAASKNHEGTVRIAIQIGREGELKSLQTTQASKYSSLNRAALKAVEKAAPFPTLPENIKSDLFELSIPITFRIQ